MKYFVVVLTAALSCSTFAQQVHVWEKVEITLTSQGSYTNPYMEVDVWVNLTGPNFDKKVYGFWDGGNLFKVRMVGVEPGAWSWTSDANVEDAGLKGRSGSFTAIAWTEEEKEENICRRGFIRAAPGGHAWMHADGSPFIMLANTSWSSMTWRLAFKNTPPTPGYMPEKSTWGFENAIEYLGNYGFNSITAIASSPNWHDDGLDLTLTDASGVIIRSCKPKNGTSTCRDMHDEDGDRPFMLPGKCASHNEDACSDLERINPEYWKNMDVKMDYLNSKGFIPYVESVRRDHGEAWKNYYEWPGSFMKYLNYLQARYGHSNWIYSLAHIDWSGYSISYEDWRLAMNAWYEKYGGMPFGQPVTVMAAASSYANMGGHVQEMPWLQAHTVGNAPKDHGMEDNLAEAVQQDPPVPGFCNEPFYLNFRVDFNAVGGELPPTNSDRENYLARSHMWGHLLNGGLAGHIIGTGSRWDTHPDEPEDAGYPGGWETLKYDLLQYQAKFLKPFILSEGLKYRELEISHSSLSDRKAPGSVTTSLDGWAHMMKTPDNQLAWLYFENEALTQNINGLNPGTQYRAHWYDVITGEFIPIDGSPLASDGSGVLTMPGFPGGVSIADRDWAVKLVDVAASPTITAGPGSSEFGVNLTGRAGGDNMSLIIHLARAGHAVCDLVSLDGRVVNQLFSGQLSSGSHHVSAAAPGLSGGLYFVRLRTGTAIVTRRIMVME